MPVVNLQADVFAGIHLDYSIFFALTICFISDPIGYQSPLAELFNFGSENPRISGENAAKVGFFCRFGYQT